MAARRLKEIVSVNFSVANTRQNPFAHSSASECAMRCHSSCRTQPPSTNHHYEWDVCDCAHTCTGCAKFEIKPFMYHIESVINLFQFWFSFFIFGWPHIETNYFHFFFGTFFALCSTQNVLLMHRLSMATRKWILHLEKLLCSSSRSRLTNTHSHTHTNGEK